MSAFPPQPTEAHARLALQRWQRNGHLSEVTPSLISAYIFVRSQTARPRLEDVLAQHASQRSSQVSGLRVKKRLVLVPKVNFQDFPNLPQEVQRWIVDPQTFVAGYEFSAQVDLSACHVCDAGILRTSVALGMNVTEVEGFFELNASMGARARQFGNEPEEPSQAQAAASAPVSAVPAPASAAPAPAPVAAPGAVAKAPGAVPAAAPAQVVAVSAASAPVSAASAPAVETRLAKRRRLVRELSEQDAEEEQATSLERIIEQLHDARDKGAFVSNDPAVPSVLFLARQVVETVEERRGASDPQMLQVQEKFPTYLCKHLCRARVYTHLGEFVGVLQRLSDAGCTMPPQFAVIQQLSEYAMDAESACQFDGVDLDTRLCFLQSKVYKDFLAIRAEHFLTAAKGACTAAERTKFIGLALSAAETAGAFGVEQASIAKSLQGAFAADLPLLERVAWALESDSCDQRLIQVAQFPWFEGDAPFAAVRLLLGPPATSAPCAWPSLPSPEYQDWTMLCDVVRGSRLAQRIGNPFAVQCMDMYHTLCSAAPEVSQTWAPRVVQAATGERLCMRDWVTEAGFAHDEVEDDYVPELWKGLKKVFGSDAPAWARALGDRAADLAKAKHAKAKADAEAAAGAPGNISSAAAHAPERPAPETAAAPVRLGSAPQRAWEVGDIVRVITKPKALLARIYQGAEGQIVQIRATFVKVQMLGSQFVDKAPVKLSPKYLELVMARVDPDDSAALAPETAAVGTGAAASSQHSADADASAAVAPEEAASASRALAEELVEAASRSLGFSTSEEEQQET